VLGSVAIPLVICPNLPEDPEVECHRRTADQEDGGTSSQQRAHPDDEGEEPGYDGHRGAPASERMGHCELEMGQPTGLTRRHAAERAGECATVAARGKEPQNPQAAPYEGPYGLGSGLSEQPFGGGRTVEIRQLFAGPHHQAYGDIEQRGTRRSGEAAWRCR